MENNNQNKTADILSVGNILIGAIKAAVTGCEYTFPENTDFKKLLLLSEKHRVTSIISQQVAFCEFAPDDIKKQFKILLFKSAARYEAQEKERQELSRLFCENEIKHCFLKGSKVAAYYDDPSIRFMLDMDLLAESEKFSLAEKILVERGYEVNTFGDDKDTGYVKPPFLNVELHRELKYEYDKGYEYYKAAQSRMVSSDGYVLNMTNEDFYVYILSHTAHHFEVAGTGIKSIVDHYYLNKKLKPLCDTVLLAEGLEAIGLKAFCDRMDSLCEYWFGSGGSTDDIQDMADYIILSGVFGTETNYYLSGIIRGEYSQKKSSYYFARLFPSYETMSTRYKILKKAKFLLPLFWVIRIITAVLKPDKIKGETDVVNSVDSSRAEQQQRFMKKMGL